MTKLVKSVLSISAVALLAARAAVAGEPAAIVEAVSAGPPGVTAMELVEPGRTVELGRDGGLVLGYIRSCVRERIRGGTVTVGTQRSIVEGGRVTRERVECKGGALALTPAQAGKSGALVFRRPPGPKQ